MANKIVSQEDMKALYSHFDAIIEIMLRINESGLTYKKESTSYAVELRQLRKETLNKI